MVREATIEQYLISRVKELGGEIRKVTWIGRRGAPDRKVMHSKLGCWVELKRPGGVLEPHQEREINRMRAMGEKVEVFSTKEQIDAWVAANNIVVVRKKQLGALLGQ